MAPAACGCPFSILMLAAGFTARQGQAEAVGTDIEVMDVSRMLLDGVQGTS